MPGETLSIKVKPSEVRLRNGDDLEYAWEVDDPSLEPLFEKHLSKHSVGAYMLLERGVGKTFRAVRPRKDENLNLTERLELAEAKASHFEQTAKESGREIQIQKGIIEEAETTINRQKEETLSWMALSQWYQARSLQCSDVLGQMMMFLQGTMTELPEWHPTQG
ncbi:hypothetical protein N7490_005204 [Penicillium lividum]|nr:hypothetical protein N7490_005204 [Penicillium lividum]